MLKLTIPNHWWLPTMLLLFTIPGYLYYYTWLQNLVSTLLPTHTRSQTEATFWGNLFSWSLLFITTGYYIIWYYWLPLLLMLQSLNNSVLHSELQKKGQETKTTFWGNHFHQFLKVGVHYQYSTLCPIKHNGLGLMGHPAKWKLTFKSGSYIKIWTYQVWKIEATFWGNQFNSTFLHNNWLLYWQLQIAGQKRKPLFEETISTLASYRRGALTRKQLLSNQTQWIGFDGTSC